MRSTLFSASLFLLCLLSPTTRICAQSFTVPKVVITGASGYAQADLLALIALKPGSTATQADVQAAAQRLGDTGLFTNIRFQSNPSGLVFSLKLMPADNLLPTRFTNFVWWTPQELNTALKARVPLYMGVVPTAGNLQENVSTALKAMLAEKGITATIDAVPTVALARNTPTAISYSIQSPEVRVHSLTLVQASPAMQPKLEKIIASQLGKPYEQDTTRDTISSQISDVYRNSGYLDFTLIDLSHTPPQVSAAAIQLDLTASISEGEPYRLSTLTWPGSDIISAADFNKFVKLKPEDIASQFALRQSLAPIARAYYSKGFQDAKVQAPATFDRTTHHVAYTVRVTPGDQYRIHSIKVLGLSDTQHTEFDPAWHMNPGDFYDVGYITEFLHRNTALRSLLGYSATYKAVSDPNTHLVDLAISFVKGGTLVDVN